MDLQLSSNNAICVGEEVTFIAQPHPDIQANVESYRWLFGDQQRGNMIQTISNTVNHIYVKSGRYRRFVLVI